MTKPKLKAVEVEGAFDKKDMEIRWIPVGKLFVRWGNAQRKEMILNHAKKIAGMFDPDKFGILSVTMPDEKGYYHVIDGVHRKTAVEMLWGENEQVPCQILPTSDPKRAAELFLALNQGRRPVKPIDNFRASVQAGDPDSVMIDKIVRAAGYRIGTNKDDGYIMAVGALGMLFRAYGPDILADTLQIIQATWGMDPNAVNAPILLAYANFLAKHHQKLNYGRLKDVMKKRFPDPLRLLATVKSVRELSGGSATQVVNQALFVNYNRGLRPGQQLVQ